MTKFYEVRDERGKAQWLAAHEETGEHRIFAWLPNASGWHRSTALEDAFYALTPEMTFEPLEPTTAAQKVAAWPNLNRKRVGWLIDDLTKAESKSSSQLGLPQLNPSRPTTHLPSHNRLRETP